MPMAAAGPAAAFPEAVLAPRSAPASAVASEAAAVALDGASGLALLDRLSALPRNDVHEYLRAHPEVVAEFQVSPPSAANVAAWWASAEPAMRSSLVGTSPAVIGNLEGVPFSIRDRANRIVLDAAMDALDDRLSGHVGRAARDEISARRHMAEQVAAALESSDGHPRRLVTLDLTGEGRAVVAVGDLTRAEYVSFLVPGMFFGVDAQIDAWTDTAEQLVNAQEEWLAHLQPGSDATVAAVAWIGYRTPGLMDVASMEAAREGQASFTAAIEGLRASRGDDQPFLSVLAHSYGSTTALLSLEHDDVSVDALGMVGSPGSPARSVHELRVAHGNVWVGAAVWDPIPASGVFGSQPTSTDYGARRFSVAPGTDPLTGDELGGAVAHNDYFTLGGSSLRNLALIAIDQEELVTAADRSAGDALKLLAKGASAPRGA